MILPARQLALSAALGLALAVAPTTLTTAQEAPPLAQTSPAQATPPANVSAILDELKRDLEQLKKDFLLFKQYQRDTDDALYGKKDGGAGNEGLYRRLAALEDKMQSVQSTLSRIEERLSKTTVGSSPLNNASVPTPTPSTPVVVNQATVRLVNEYQTEVSLIVNGVSYRLLPGEVRSLSIPAGSYSYELLAPGSRAQTSTIKDGETVTLRIR